MVMSHLSPISRSINPGWKAFGTSFFLQVLVFHLEKTFIEAYMALPIFGAVCTEILANILVPSLAIVCRAPALVSTHGARENVMRTHDGSAWLSR